MLNKIIKKEVLNILILIILIKNNMLYLIIIILLVVLILLYKSPTIGLIPYNWLVSLVTYPQVYYTTSEKRAIFPESILFETNWESIRDEALKVFDMSGNNTTQNLINIEKIGNVGEAFLNQSKRFYKGWSTFPLKMFDKDIKANQELCPTLTRLLKKSNNVTTAFFSLMEPYKFLDPHYGPFKGILRYHLGLQIPPPEAGPCYISVNNIKYTWENGKGVLFDESYEHFVHNDTPYPRIILFLDIKRPFDNEFMNILNDIILKFIELSPHNRKLVKKYNNKMREKIIKEISEVI